MGIIILPVEILLSFIFHDFFFILASNSFLAPVIAQLPFMVGFWTYVPFICGIFVALSLVLTFAKPAGGG